MTQTEILNDVIAQLDPEDVPVKYILLAKVMDFKGDIKIFKGKELEELWKNPGSQEIAEARCVMNVKKMRKDAMTEIDYLFDEVNRRFQRKF